MKMVNEIDQAYEQLQELDQDALLQLVGGAVLDPSERLTAALEAFGGQDVAARLEADGALPGRDAIDLVARGRQALASIIAERKDELSERICQAYKHAAERELVLDVAPICGDVISSLAGAGEPVSLGVAGALLVVRYGLDRLCGSE